MVRSGARGRAAVRLVQDFGRTDDPDPAAPAAPAQPSLPSTAAAPTPPAKRGRGRPPGSRNKAKRDLGEELLN